MSSTLCSMLPPLAIRVVIRATTTLNNMQCNNVKRQVERKGLPLLQGLKSMLQTARIVESVFKAQCDRCSRLLIFFQMANWFSARTSRKHYLSVHEKDVLKSQVWACIKTAAINVIFLYLLYKGLCQPRFFKIAYLYRNQMRMISKEKKKMRQEVLTLKCNCSFLDMWSITE